MLYLQLIISIRLPNSRGKKPDLFASAPDLAQACLSSDTGRSLYSQGGLQYSLGKILLFTYLVFGERPFMTVGRAAVR